MDSVEAVLERVAHRRPALIDLGLGRVLRTLERLGAPHRSLPPTFHVAGTNGKGSTVAYLRSILEASGARVHAFTSPHLVRHNERISLAGREIGDEAFVGAIERVDAAAGADDLTFFETLACAGFLAFAETPGDFLILEVGLGGRLDATNVLDRPIAAVVTPIALDHQNFLGATLALIAREKAGIFRAGAPAVVGRQSAEAMGVFESHALAENAPLFAFGMQWSARSEGGRLIYQDDAGLSDLAPPRLVGAHQFDNAGIAVAALKAVGIPLRDETLSKGIAEARWPARLQRLKSGLIVDIMNADGDAEIWLDGGHNPHAAQAISQTMADLEEKLPKPLALIAGMQENKNAEEFFAAFSGLAASVFTVAANHAGARDPISLAEAAERSGLRAQPCSSLEEAARLARGKAPVRVLICGSLYLAGDVLKTHA